MSAIDDAKIIINILTNGTADNAQMLRIADHFYAYEGVAVGAVDPQNPTNEEKAQNFINMLRAYGRQVLRSDAARVTRESNDAAVEAAATAAESDL